METRARFFLIPCRVCYTTTVILEDRRTPPKCVKCRAPYDPVSVSFKLAGSAAIEAPGEATDSLPPVV